MIKSSDGQYFALENFFIASKLFFKAEKQMLRKQTQQFLIQIRTENVVYKLLKNYKERQFHARKVYRREVALGINCRPRSSIKTQNDYR